MTNGYSVEEMLKRIERRLERVEEKLDAVSMHGCAHREDDLFRIKNLESWKTRGIVGFVGLILATLYEFIFRGGR